MLKSMWRFQGPRITKVNLIKNNKFGELILIDFKLLCHKNNQESVVLA
jgi:hypothetical protein